MTDRSDRILSGLLLIGLVLIYGGSLNYGPIIDDPPQIKYVQEFADITDAWGVDSTQLFRPVKNLLFYTLGASESLFPLRLTGLFIFWLTCIAFYRFCRFLLTSTGSWFAAFLYAFHPSQVASVAFPSAYNNIVCAFFIFVFSSFLLRIYRCDSVPPHLWMILFGAAAGALFSYELGVALLPITILLTLFERSWLVPRRIVFVFSGLLILLFVYLATRSGMEASVQMNHFMLPPDTSNLDLMLSAPFYTLRHFAMGVFPLWQGGVLLVDDPSTRVAVAPFFWLGFGVVVATAVYFGLVRKNVFSLGLLFFVAAMAPLSNWIPLRNGPITNYYLLVPLGGIGIAFGFLTDWVNGRLKGSQKLIPRSQKGIAWTVLVGLFFGSLFRVGWWEDKFSLNTFTLRNQPENWVAWNNQGAYLGEMGLRSEALNAYSRSLEFAPWYDVPRENIAWIFNLEKRYEDALVMIDGRVGPMRTTMGAAKAVALIETGRYEEASKLLPLINPKLLNQNQARWLRGLVDRNKEQLGEEGLRWGL